MRSELAYAKVNLVLQVGAPRPDGLHPLCSLFASIDLADELSFEPADEDSVDCVEVGGENLATSALRAFREAAGEEQALHVRIDKRIPVAAGLGGGSADAAAVLRAANALAERPLPEDRLLALASALGSDVPSQVQPGHALVTGVGEHVEPIALPPMALVLVPQRAGLSTGEAYAELDRLGGWRDRLDPERVRRLAAAPLTELAAGVENDLQSAALSLRPELEEPLAALRAAGALTAAVSGSGPTTFGVFEDEGGAERAADGIEGALVARVREG